MIVSRYHAEKSSQEKTIDGHKGLADAEFAEKVFNLGYTLVKAAFKPTRCKGIELGLLCFGDFPAFDQTEGVPNFVAEITALLYELVVVHDVVAGRGCKHQAHAHTVGTIVADKVEGVGRVAEFLAHLAAEGVANDTGKVDVAEWLVRLHIHNRP